MNSTLIERIDHCLKYDELPTVAVQTFELCKAALTQQQEAEPAGYLYEFKDPFTGAPVWRGSAGEWNLQRPRSSRPYFFSPPKPAAQPQVPDADEMYMRFLAWCQDNKQYDLDPRLHTHSGKSVSAGAYISDRKTSIAFRAYRDGAISAAKEEGKRALRSN